MSPPSSPRPVASAALPALAARVPWRPLLLLTVTVLTWAPTLHGGAVNYDDPWLIMENPLLSPGDPAVLPAIWTDLSAGTRLTLGTELLPVRDSSVLLDFALWGDDLRGHHAQNLAWYALAVLLLHGLLRRLLGDPDRALAGALIWATMPVHAESLAWLSSRKDVLSAALLFLALGAGLRGGVAAAPWTLAAMWAKSTAVVAPLWLLRAGAPRRTVAATLVVAGAATLLASHVGRVLGLFAPRHATTPLEWLGFQGHMTARYLQALLWPPSLSPRYPAPGLDLSWGHLPWLALVALAFRRGPVGLGAAWTLLALLPVCQLLPLQNLVADRYLLLPTVGLCLALAAALPRRLVLPVGLGLALLQAPFAAHRSLAWRDSVSLWADAVESTPTLPDLRVRLAGALTARGEPGDRQAAGEILARAEAEFPDAPDVVASHALHRMEEGDPGAEEALLRALALDPDHRKALNNLVVLRLRQGRAAQTQAACARLAAVHPGYPEGWNTCGVAAMQRGELDLAQAAFEEVLRQQPFDAAAPCNLGAVAWQRGDPDAAAAAWTTCLERDPAHVEARRGLELLGRRPPPL